MSHVLSQLESEPTITLQRHYQTAKDDDNGLLLMKQTVHYRYVTLASS